MQLSKHPLWHAAETNQYPPGTTAKTLASVRDTWNSSLLHFAAAHGNLPPGTTIEDLIACKDNEGWSALHVAADNDRLPPETSVHHLADCYNNEKLSALYIAAQRSSLPSDTTIQILKDCQHPNENSAWVALLDRIEKREQPITWVPPQIFYKEPEIATQLATQSISKYPKHKAAILVWLATTFTPPTTTPTMIVRP